MEPPSFAFPVSDDDDDPAFLSAIDAVEADGLRRLSHGHDGFDLSPPPRKHDRTPSHQPSESVPSSVPRPSSCLRPDAETTPSKRPRSGPEGEYLAALRGNHSKTWQALNSKLGDTLVRTPGYGRASYANPGAGNQSLTNAAGVAGDTGGRTRCFHCGKEGHWAKDCPVLSKDPDGGPPVPEKNCPCGGGICKVLTANTEKNAGRRFYRCPSRKDEGQCAFFEWCDAAANTDMSPRAEKGDSSKASELTCPCGAGPCTILTAKTERNLGRQFYKCPLNQGEGSCGFFKWCDEITPALSGPSFDARVTEKPIPSSRGSTAQCFTCGMDGHWSKECPHRTSGNFLSKSSHASTGLANTEQSDQRGGGAFGTCFKCGEVGHWSKDCSSSHSGYANRGSGMGSCYKCGSVEHFTRDCPNAGGVGNSKFSPRTGTVSGSCFTCGGPGHWSSNCPNAGSKGSGMGRGTSTGSCYKCGAQGHWSSECPDSANTRSSTFGGQFGGPSFNNKLAGETGGTRNCYKCGGIGHWANDCTGNTSGNKVRRKY